jgi:two-component system invasion response regulator UvrY
MKVLLVDDHVAIRDCIKRNIETQGGIHQFAEADNADDALLLLKKQVFDVVVLDLSMDGIDGMDLLRIIRKKYPANHVMIYTMHSPLLYGVQAIEDGALSYITKNTSLRELLMAIMAVARGEKYITTELSVLMADALNQQANGSKEPKLSAKQIEVSKRMAKGLSNQEIAVELGISYKTVCNHFERIKIKLGFTKKSEVIAYINKNHPCL